MARHIRTEMEIQASPERVWSVLTDVDAYPVWNPLLRVEGTYARVGGRLRVTVTLPDGTAMSFRPRVVERDPPHRLCWLGRLGVPGLFDGRHCFTIEPLGPQRVRLIQCERFSGLLVPLVARRLLEPTRRGFQAMNEALRDRAERAAGTAGD